MAVNDYRQNFIDAGNEWNVDPTLMMAVGHQESGGNPKIADSPAGARGLMQIMPDTGKELGLTDPYDANQSIYAGTKYMRQMLDKYPGRPDIAVMAYNAGPGRMDAAIAGKGGIPQETMNYLPAVNAHYKRFAANNNQSSAPTKTDAQVNGQQVPTQSIDDFLKATTGDNNKQSPNMSVDDFLAQTTAPKSPGAPINSDGPAQYAQPASAATPPVDPAAATDAYGNPTPEALAAIMKQGSDRGGKAFSAIADATKRGSQTGGILTPYALSGLDKYAGTPLAIPANTLRQISDVPRALNALMSGGLEAVNQAGGRNAAALAESIMADAGSRPGMYAAGAPGGAAASGSGAPVNRLLPSEPVPAVTSSVPAAGVVAEAAKPPPSPVAGEPTAIQQLNGAKSAGAAATPDGANAIPDSTMRAARGDVELRAAMEPAARGTDTTEYVPGSVPTKAEYSGSPAISQQERLLRERNPNAFDPVLQQNNEARVAHYDDMAGTKTQVDTAKQTVDATAEKQREAVWSNKTTMDAAPIISSAEGLLDSASASRPAVKGAISDVLETIKSDPRNLTDPERMYAVRQHLNDLIDGKAGSEKSSYKLATKQLIELRGVMDDAIEQAAPGFKAYLSDYSEARKPINAMETLQEFRPMLTNSKGEILPDRYNRFVRNLAQSRSEGGIDPSKAIPDETMTKLLNIDADLKRSGNIKLGGALGSPTNLNAAIETAMGIGKGAALLGAHAVAGTISPVLGNMALESGRKALSGMTQRRQLNRMTQDHLAPPTNNLMPKQD